jgi:lipoprotein-anchoring transpeptidase ErfK/SrfK
MSRRLWHTIVLVIVLLLSLPRAAFAAPQATGGGYVVKSGDTLGDIAWRLGVSSTALRRENGIANSNAIYPGQVLTIPGHSAEDAASVESAEQDYAESETAGGGKWIDVDLTEQRLRAYRGDTLVFNTLVSTGIEGYDTPEGEFAIEYMVEWQTMQGDDYYLPDVPYVMYFADYFAIHGTYWHDNFGHPMSHGCINLTIPDSAWLYDWANIGTPVVIHY